jgi:ABC-type Fe3+/spermidine/putrescine transport system ATPase subunit
MSALLTVEGISKRYEGRPLLTHLSFEVAAGEIVCLLGPSGTGKTTLLRIIAGLEEPEAGLILLDGKDLTGVPPHARGFGMMFQDLALFPHRNVYDNVAFGLRMQNAPAANLRERVTEALALVGLDAPRFLKRDVNSLSGGEQQRVALARTLAPRPRLVMFDEPLGALDRMLREELVRQLRALLERLHMTALYVTHDQDEAFAIADRLLLLNAGRIQQAGAPIEVYHHPANVFVARFLGLTNLLEIRAREQEDGAARIRTDAGIFRIPAPRGRGDETYILLRPRAIERLVSESQHSENVVRGILRETVWQGGRQHILVETGGGEFEFEWDQPVTRGAAVALELNPAGIQLVAEGA